MVAADSSRDQNQNQNLWNAQQQRPRPRRSTGASMASACDQCHRCKVRCNGGRPSCERCQKYDSICTYSLGKPLGKPPKNGRRKPLPPPVQLPLPAPQVSSSFPPPSHPRSHSRSNSHTSSGQDGNSDLIIAGAQKSGSIPTTINDNVPHPEVESTQRGGVEDIEQYLPHDDSHALLSATEDNLNFFDGSGSVEEMNLDFLVTDFGPDSWTTSKSKENTSSSLAHEVTMTNTDHFGSPLISHTEPLTSITLSQESSDERRQIETCLDIENSGNVSVEASSGESNENGESHQHLPLLLETTLRLYFKTPSITQTPISEALRLAKQGLQAIQQCLGKFSLLSHAQVSFEPSSHEPPSPEIGSANPGSELSSILACILLMDKVLLCYDSLLKRRSGDVSSPYAPSPAPPSNSIPNPTASSSSTHHRMQPIFIGDFEVEGKASWKMILDAVVTAEKQEARNTVSKLEDWASDLIGKGKNEGRLAMTFLDQLKWRFHN